MVGVTVGGGMVGVTVGGGWVGVTTGGIVGVGVEEIDIGQATVTEASKLPGPEP